MVNDCRIITHRLTRPCAGAFARFHAARADRSCVLRPVIALIAAACLSWPCRLTPICACCNMAGSRVGIAFGLP